MVRDGRIVVFGAGKVAGRVFAWLSERRIEPVAIVDSSPGRWGAAVCGTRVRRPEALRELSFDWVLVASPKYFDEISALLTETYSVPGRKILRPYALFCEETLAFYAAHPELVDTGEKELLLEEIRRNGDLSVFNYPFARPARREAIPVEVHFDGSCSLFYVIYNGKKMYMARRFTSERAVASYMRGLATEQHKNSPHRYLDENFAFEGGVVLDAGVAEGNFALDVLDRARHVVLVEADEAWCEALRRTFAPYSGKVTIVQKFLSGADGADSVTLDTLSEQFDFDFIKMDIEGGEVSALKGGAGTLSRAKPRKLAVCAYHNVGDERAIKELLSGYGYSAAATQGYMAFVPGMAYPVQFVRGVVRAQKKGASGRKPNVCIWGRGRCSETVRSSLKEAECNFLGFVDKDPALSGCVPPERLKSMGFDYVVISAKNSAPILRHAAELGISGGSLIDWWNGDVAVPFIDGAAKKIALLEERLALCRLRAENAPHEYGDLPKPTIKPADELLELLAKDRLSLCRFGDGEFEMMREAERPWFQSVSKELARRLKEIVRSDAPKVVVAVADNFGNLDKYTERAADGIRKYMSPETRASIMRMLDARKTYYDAYVSRPYIIYRDKAHSRRVFGLWKEVFRGRSILVVEGRYSRYGRGNDLFVGAASVRRIVCPEKNAFGSYAEILSAVLSNARKGDLVLASLGPAATVLAYDLAGAGFQAIDVGQLDNEYDWYCMGAESRVAVPGKCVAEVAGAHVPDEIEDAEFEAQVVAVVG